MKPKHLTILFIFLLGCLFPGCGSGRGGSSTNGTTSSSSTTPALITVASGYPSPSSINVKGTVGNSASSIQVILQNDAGTTLDGHTIIFSITSGPGGGEYLSRSNVSTSLGIASTTLYSGTKSGIVTVEAALENNNALKTTLQVEIKSGPPVGEEFGISAEHLNLSGLWMSNLEDTITVNLADKYGNAVSDNTAVSFNTYNTGGFFSSSSSLTASGLATNTLKTPGTYTAPLEGFVSVTAETEGGPSTRVTSIAVTPSPDNNIMYVGTNGGGIYKSTDGGQSWENYSKSTENSRAGQNWLDPYIKGKQAIAIDPDNHNQVYVGTGYLGSGHLYRSLDGGQNWNSDNTEEWSGILNLSNAILSVLCDDAGSDYVWLGTEGKGIMISEDGTSFHYGGLASTPVAGPGNVGTGYLGSISLSPSAITETWTVTYTLGSVQTSTPTFSSSSGAQGNMTTPVATTNAADETWTITYQGGFNPSNNPIIDQNSHGQLVVIAAKAIATTYHITCTNATDGSETFSVYSEAEGWLPPLEDITSNYESEAISFYILETSNFTVGDEFTLTTTADSWSVSGSVSGSMSSATTNSAYNNGYVSFTINSMSEGSYQYGDTWTFRTTPAYAWLVQGSSSGLQTTTATTDVTYTSDNGALSFAIYSGSTPFAVGDNFSFQVTASGLGLGKIVREIEKLPGTNGASAILFAGTATGLYKSENGGLTWSEISSFTGDSITAIALHPDSSADSETIYLGTADAGLWMTKNGGTTWEQISSGLSEQKIKDLILDNTHHILYTLTYADDQDRAYGKIYSATLDAEGNLTSFWQDVSTGLPQIDSTTSETSNIFPLYVLGFDLPDSPSVLFVGGEGITFYRTEQGLDNGTPSWTDSGTGLNNTIMARMPILFSGSCTMNISKEQSGDLVTFKVYIQDSNGNPPIEGSSFTVVLNDDTQLYSYDYPDLYTTVGTWRDPGDPSTDNPITITTTVQSEDKIVFTFTPACGTSAPGCSGSDQEVTYNF